MTTFDLHNAATVIKNQIWNDLKTNIYEAIQAEGCTIEADIGDRLMINTNGETDYGILDAAIHHVVSNLIEEKRESLIHTLDTICDGVTLDDVIRNDGNIAWYFLLAGQSDEIFTLKL